MTEARIGVLSDTHGNKGAIEGLRGKLLDEYVIGRLYHLGDSFEDAERLLSWGVPVLRIPGIYCPEYKGGKAPRKLFDEVAGRRHLLVHAEADITPEDLQEADAVFLGHTHRYDIAVKDGVLFVNPGHLKAPVDKGRPASFALVEAGTRELRVEIVALETGAVLDQRSLS